MCPALTAPVNPGASTLCVCKYLSPRWSKTSGGEKQDEKTRLSAEWKSHLSFFVLTFKIDTDQASPRLRRRSKKTSVVVLRLVLFVRLRYTTQGLFFSYRRPSPGSTTTVFFFVSRRVQRERDASARLTDIRPVLHRLRSLTLRFVIDSLNASWVLFLFFISVYIHTHTIPPHAPARPAFIPAWSRGAP